MIPRCNICPCVPRRSPVPPSGPSPCRLLFIGECPHKTEDILLIPFAGDTGAELDGQYLPLAGLDRSNVAVTNAVWCSQPSYRNPHPGEAAICSQKHLPALLARLAPEIIIPMGAVACSLFPSLSLNLHHGLPQPGRYADWEGIVFPTYHPSAGIHSTAYMIPLRQDMQALGELIKTIDEGTFEWPSDPYPVTDYQIIRSPSGIMDYLAETIPANDLKESQTKSLPWLLDQISVGLSISTDTETRPSGSPYCLTFSVLPGTGRLIYASSKDLILRYTLALRRLNPLLLLHNYLFDAKPYESMDIPIPSTRFLDTMVRAYELCLGGGGDEEDSGGRGSLSLKVLAFRHLHMQMRTFEETVLPHTLPHVLSWLSVASSLLSADSAPVCRCSHKRPSHAPWGKSQRLSGPCLVSGCPCFKWTPIKRPKAQGGQSSALLSRKVNSLRSSLSAGEFSQPQSYISSTGEACARARRQSTTYKHKKNVNPWDRIKNWNEGELGMLEELAGPFPTLDVALLPEGELLAYAVRDADATLRLNRYLNGVKLAGP